MDEQHPLSLGISSLQYRISIDDAAAEYITRLQLGPEGQDINATARPASVDALICS